MTKELEILLYRLVHFGSMGCFDENGSYEEDIHYLTKDLTDDDWIMLEKASEELRLSSLK